MALRHVVFDIGNVLLDWDPRHLYRTVFHDDADRMEWFLGHICTPAWNLEQDRGRSWAEAVGTLIAQHPEWRAEIELFDRRWQSMIPDVIAGSVALLETLRQQRIRLFAITNFSREKYRESVERFPFLGWFEGVVVSGDERLLKPDPQIFELLLKRYGLDASDCVFIDDNAENVKGAAAIGMTAIQFTGPDDLRASLRALGFEV